MVYLLCPQSKFASLSLAFRTDKLTVDQRTSVQERARDLAEKNVDRELQSIREAVEVGHSSVLQELLQNRCFSYMYTLLVCILTNACHAKSNGMVYYYYYY